MPMSHSGNGSCYKKEVEKRYNEAKFEKARKYLDPLLQKIRESTKVVNPLSRLATLMDELLCDQINIGDESEPILREFWNQPEMYETRKKAMELRDEATKTQGATPEQSSAGATREPATPDARYGRSPHCDSMTGDAKEKCLEAEARKDESPQTSKTGD